MTASFPSARLVSLLFAAGFVAALSVFPLAGTWLLPILTAYLALLIWRPQWWLFALPALLPVLDLAPVTGWFFCEEIDLVLLLTASICYWHLPRAAGELPTWPLLFRFGLIMLAVACLIGLWRGMHPIAPLDVNAFNNYLSPYNALRIGKAWLWALIFLLPLKQAAGPRLDGLTTYFVPGMLAGLFLVACAATRERLQFPGLLNFSTDYRITAPFSAMHTGGAALDGYLAMTFPLLAVGLFALRSAKTVIAAALLLPLALYAGLATFSRGLYLGLAVAVAAMLAVPVMKTLAAVRASHRRTPDLVAIVAASLAALLVALLLLDQIFRASGYRGYISAIVVMAATLALVAQRPRPAVPLGVLLSGLVSGLVIGAALALALAWWLPFGHLPYGILKGPYLLFICAALAFATISAMGWLAGGTQAAAVRPLATAAHATLLLSACWIAYHTAGAATVLPSGGLLLLAISPLGPALTRNRPLWRPTRQGAIAAFAALLLLASIVPVYNGYYVEERFSTLHSDLSHRLRHWSDALSMMDDGLATSAAGMGLGKFPATYYWRNSARELPPSYQFVTRDGNRFLRLSPGSYPAGYGEMLRWWQTVDVAPGQQFALDVDFLHITGQAFLHLRLCERQLLYPVNCSVVPVRQLPTSAQWQHQRFRLNAGPLGRPGIPVRLELAAQGQGVAFDIDNISLRDVGDGRERLRNGDFSDSNNYWFFSSDRHHLPWHVKNLYLNLYFEMGWAGVLAFTLLLSTTIVALMRRAWRQPGGMPAAAWLAAILAFQVVGLFDSLFDVPRITLLFMLLLCAAALRPAPTPGQTMEKS